MWILSNHSFEAVTLLKLKPADIPCSWDLNKRAWPILFLRTIMFNKWKPTEPQLFAHFLNNSACVEWKADKSRPAGFLQWAYHGELTACPNQVGCRKFQTESYFLDHNHLQSEHISCLIYSYEKQDYDTQRCIHIYADVFFYSIYALWSEGCLC